MHELLRKAFGDITEKTKNFACSFNSNRGEIHTTKHAEVHKIVKQDQ
jgi:hypothetical protein